MPDLHQIAIHFAPEIILTASAIALLLYDLAIRPRRGAQASVAVATLVLALVATIALWLLAPQAGAEIFEARNAMGEVIRAGAFVSDGLTHFFRFISLMATLLVTLSAIRFMRDRTAYGGEFLALLLFAALAIDLVAGANDLIVVVLSIEFLSITSYVLAGYLKHDVLSLEGALKYFLYGSITGATMLMGMVLLYGATGSTSLPAVAQVLRNPESIMVHQLQHVVGPALLLVIVGMGYKIALVPFHQWSPDAYQGAPTPVTAFLSVGPKAAGMAILIRFFVGAFGQPAISPIWLTATAALAAITMVVGNLTALTQRNVKRMMAYSSIAQAGYMTVGLVSAASAGLPGVGPLSAVLVYVLAYLFTNLGAFAIIIAVDDETGSSDVEAYAGLMQRAPFMTVALFVFFLSLVGIPPLAGFIGKFAVFSAAIASGQGWLALIGVLTGVISVGYYFRIARQMLFVPPAEGAGPVRLAPGLAFVAVMSLVMVFAIGLLANPFIELANQAAGVIPQLVGAVARGG